MSIGSPGERAGGAGHGLVKSPLDIGGGLFLIALAALGFAGGFNLPFGTLSGIGSGLMPQGGGDPGRRVRLLLLVQALVWDGDHLERWHVRGPVFVLGAVLVFAVFIRGSTLTSAASPASAVGIVKVPPLGLIVAGPLAVMFSSLADKDTRPLEVVIFAVVMTLLCGLLFKELLSLPIPFDPAGLVPEPINHAYVGVKSPWGKSSAASRT